MNRQTTEKLVSYLREFIIDERWESLNKVLEERTRHICVVLEDIYQSHNASAVLRSCDCFGIQDVHIIENDNNFSLSKGVTIGADRWLTLAKYREKKVNNTRACLNKLRKEGYRIIATTPHEQDVTIDQLPIDQKTALLFGAELEGLSEQAMNMADGYAKIPIHGFSESYNISVSAALCLYELTSRLRKSDIRWQLPEDQKTELLLNWLEKSIRASEQLKEKFFENTGYSAE